MPVHFMLALALGFAGRPAHSDEPLPSINLPIEDAYAKGFLQDAYARIGTTDAGCRGRADADQAAR
jgi:hypothetical protein